MTLVPPVAKKAAKGVVGVRKNFTTVVIPTEYDGTRLDKALELLAPDQGARQRKRLLQSGAVRVDGRIRPKGYLVRAGQYIAFSPPTHPSGDSAHLLPRIIARTDAFAALFKTGNRHSQTVFAGGSPGVDVLLTELFPESKAWLLNRLDYLTSGLLLVGLSLEAGQLYHKRQDAGEVFKHYFALVHGRLENGFTATNALDTAKRRKVKVLQQYAEPLRHSLVRPLFSERMPQHSDWRTLVYVRIQKGARHQIRAHLAAYGHSIVGDPLYGTQTEGSVLYLHHFAICFSEFSADARPDWPDLSAQCKEILRTFMPEPPRQ